MIMAIAIKSIPTLKNTDAKAFIKKAETSSKKRATVDFRKHVVTSNAILDKAKLK
jgi:hypothetical protein